MATRRRRRRGNPKGKAYGFHGLRPAKASKKSKAKSATNSASNTASNSASDS